MPIFDFKCKSCGHIEHDVSFGGRFSSVPETATGIGPCPKCGGDMEKLPPTGTQVRIGKLKS